MCVRGDCVCAREFVYVCGDCILCVLSEGGIMCVF